MPYWLSSAHEGRHMERIAGLIAVALLAMAALGPTVASADPKGAFVIGQSAAGGDGGQFDGPRDVAVDEGTGDVFVVDKNNHRIQRFGPDGAFELAWGWDVVESGGLGDVGGDSFEICTAATDCKAGSPGGTEGGRLELPTGIAIDQANDWVYVWNTAKSRIDKFTTDGAWLLTFGDGVAPDGDVCTVGGDCLAGVAGDDAGQLGLAFLEPSLAVHPATSDVFVADPTNRRVDHFEADGDFVRAWGWNVDPAGGSDFEICTAVTQCQAGSGGKSTFDNNTPLHVAVGPDGVVYAGDSLLQPKIYRFDSSETVASGMLLTPIVSSDISTIVGIEVDQDDGHLFTAIDGLGILEFETTPPTLLRTIAEGGLPSIKGYGLDGDSAAQYVATSNFVVVFNEAGAPLATAPLAPEGDNEGAHSVDLSISVTPNGPAEIPATGRFEVSKNGVDWQPVGAPVDLGTGTSPVDVDQTITGIEAHQTYDVRFVITKPYGNPPVISPAGEFTTLTVAPDVTTGAPQFVAARSAQVIARVNPNNLPTTYRVEYGTTTGYGASAPVPDGDAGSAGLERTLLVKLTGLEPETTYHYRVVATNSEGTSEGIDRQFTTRALPEPVFPPRGLEMVTPPDKNNRRTNPILKLELPNPGIPSPDGDSMMYAIQFGILDAESGVEFPHTFDVARLDRKPTGWKAEDLHNVASPISGIGSVMAMVGSSADFAVQAWQHKSYMFGDTKSTLSTRLFGDSGGPLGKGWYDWLGFDPVAAGIPNTAIDAAVIDDDGERMLRWSGETGYQGLLGPSDPSNAQVEDADAVYLQEPVGSGPRHLVNECTGTATLEQQTVTMTATGGTFTLTFDGRTTATIAFNASAAVVKTRLEGLSNVEPGDVDVTKSGSIWTVSFTGGYAGVDVPELVANTGSLTGGTATVATSTDGAPGPNATTIPTRLDNGTSGDLTDDTLGERPCVAGIVTSVRGAVGGGGDVSNPAGGTLRTAMSRDGGRVFFTSPDPGLETGPTSCTSGIALATACPPQVFVRQYSSSGQPSVRWISRPEVDGQAIGLVGSAGFEGASGDGKVVFFKSKAPLTTDDPNGGAPVPGGVTTGTTSDASWDLYRYELPGDRNADPAGGELTRVSGGPGGAFDPNVHSGTGSAGALRYLSDDGERAYFVTRGVIGSPGDSWNEPPEGAASGPGGDPSSTERNLYLYDASKTGDQRWKFIAQLPTSGHEANGCASLSSRSGMTEDFVLINVAGGQLVQLARLDNNCVRGVPDGRAIAFESGAQLTDDDTDQASDVYFYDAVADELVRVSAAPDDESGYVCAGTSTRCNGDFGFQPQITTSNDQIGSNGAQRMNIARNGNGTVSVFFESRIPLVPEDANGTRMDVYEWQAGALSIVSPGDSADHDAYFSGNSGDGRDVFFATAQSLDPREIDKDYDIYDARVGGGFPYTPPPPGCDTLGDKCAGPGAGGLSGKRGTENPGADGDADEIERRSLRVRGPSAKARRRAARSGKLALRVRLSGPGRVTATARSRFGGKTRKVGKGSKRLSKAGRAVVRVKLNKAARKRLRRGRALVLTVSVAAPGALTRTVDVRLERAGR